MKSLAEQMYVYASYHRDGRNKAFHFLGVPLITMSLFIPMAWLRLVDLGVDWVGLSLATLFVAVALVYYFLLDVGLAVGMILVITPLLLLGEYLASLGYAMGGIAFGVAFVGGWIIQLVGHAFEGRKPALADNLFQVFVAPVFLLAEVYFALGWKRAVEQEVEAMIAERGLYGTEETRGGAVPAWPERCERRWPAPGAAVSYEDRLQAFVSTTSRVLAGVAGFVVSFLFVLLVSVLAPQDGVEGGEITLTYDDFAFQRSSADAALGSTLVLHNVGAVPATFHVSGPGDDNVTVTLAADEKVDLALEEEGTYIVGVTPYDWSEAEVTVRSANPVVRFFEDMF